MLIEEIKRQPESVAREVLRYLRRKHALPF